MVDTEGAASEDGKASEGADGCELPIPESWKDSCKRLSISDRAGRFITTAAPDS